MPTPQSARPEAERTITTVTHENAEAYYAERLGETPAPEEAPESEPVEAAQTEEKPVEKVEVEETEDLDKAHKEGKLSTRFKEITDRRKAAEATAATATAQAKAEREARMEAERVAADLKAKYEPPKSDEVGPEPQPSQFTDINEYAKALKEWAADQTRRDDAAQQAQKQAEQRQEQVRKDWNDRLVGAKAKYADYDAKIDAASLIKVPNAAVDAIVNSEIGPEINYYIADHPEFAENLFKLTPARQAAEIGKLEMKLMEPPKAPEKGAKPASAEISRAPAPISPLKGGKSPEVPKLDSDNVFHGTYDEWKAARKSGKIK